jgi:FlaA1/EpsC-like NDP-sugar epimerase
MFDDNASKHGRRIGDVPILGLLNSLSDHVQRLGAKHAIIAMPTATVAQRRRATEVAARAGLTVFTVPASADILAGRISISQVRKVELEDLLGRDPVQLDAEGLHRLLTDRVVLVTGAGGSIGSELARQISHYGPRLLVFYEQSEFALYAIEQEFAGRPIACAVGDVKDEAQLDAVFRQYRPEVVFHAAAYKHVPLMENGNAWAAVRNNVLGTYRVARAAIEYGAREFVLISTDKAVNPTNVMGASKRLAEMVCQTLQAEAATTRFVMVRFGNVLGSSGSVIPKFREQIARGGPVTVTHPDIIRYFMLIPEAAQLVLQAGLMGQGGEIFVLDMGEPVKIADLARDMIRLSGFSDDDIRVEFTGLRPGEKLFEELLADGEATVPTPHPKLRIARPSSTLDQAWLADLLAWLDAPVRQEAETKSCLRQRVPEYRPANH